MKRLFASFLLISLAPFSMAPLAGAEALHNASFVIGSSTGGTTWGVEYAYKTAPSYSLGGFIRSFQKKTSGPYPTDGEFIIGANAPIHFYQQAHWDFSLAPGFAIVDVNSKSDKPGDATTVGPNLALNMLYNINDRYAVGIEAARYWIWFNSDYAGIVREDLALKFQVAF